MTHNTNSSCYGAAERVRVPHERRVGPVPRGHHDSCTAARQFDVVRSQFTDQGLSWAEEACKAVAFRCCEHTSCPPAMSGTGSGEQRKAEAAAHSGLCGVHHACFITSVSLADVAARGNGVGTTKGLFRSQVRNTSGFFWTHYLNLELDHLSSGWVACQVRIFDL